MRPAENDLFVSEIQMDPTAIRDEEKYALKIAIEPLNWSSSGTSMPSLRTGTSRKHWLVAFLSHSHAVMCTMPTLAPDRIAGVYGS